MKKARKWAIGAIVGLAVLAVLIEIANADPVWHFVALCLTVMVALLAMGLAWIMLSSRR